MTILNDDIKLFESDTMNDSETGGGALTGQLIVAGQSNNIFDDVSQLDRVYGAVHLRKVFGNVNTQTLDKYYGSHVIISKLPGDEKLGMTLFNTDSWFDRRPDAQNRIENYLGKGAKYPGFLWATQFQGSKVVNIFQSLTSPIPGIGDVLVLTDNTNEQFVRIVSIDESVQQFTDNVGTYKRRILVLEISDALDNDFVGAQMNRYDSLTPSATLFDSVVANAAKYYSSRPITQPLLTNDLTVQVDSVFNQIVPSSSSEAGIIDKAPSEGTDVLLSSSLENVIMTNGAIGADALMYDGGTTSPRVYLPTPIEPNTTNTFRTLWSLSTDNGDGTTTSSVVTINYEGGYLITPYTNSRIIDFNYTPRFRISGATDSVSIPVTAANQGFVWVVNLKPIPKPASTRISYMSLGKWYTLIDDGTGNAVGSDTSLGSATIDFTTGSVTVTTGFLPDADTEILFSWGTESQYTNRSTLTPDKPYVDISLGNTGIQPDTLALSWTDGTAKTANGTVNGGITGDASGTVDPSTGLVKMRLNSALPKGTIITINYGFGAPTIKTISSFGQSGTTLTVDLGDTNIIPGSVKLDWSANVVTTGLRKSQLISNIDNVGFLVRDDGLGNLTDLLGVALPGASIDYVAGTLTFDSALNYNVYHYDEEVTTYTRRRYNIGGEYESVNYKYKTLKDNITFTGFPSSIPSAINASYRTTSTNNAPTEQYTINEYHLDLTEGFAEEIVPSTTQIRLFGDRYFDRNGIVYYRLNPGVGAGTQVGSIDYVSGIITIDSWSLAISPYLHPTPELQSMFTDSSVRPVPKVMFRVPVAPVKVESLTVRAVPYNTGSGEISVTADNIGRISGPGMEGYIDYQTGIVSITFGTEVVAAGNESEDWYDAGNVDLEGNIIRPEPVLADTIKYNAVSLTNIPLSADILGLDPVRLPIDGKVPIYDVGDVVVILNDAVTSATYNTNDVVDLNQVRLSKVTVRDSGNVDVPVAKWSVDLDTGILTFGDLAGVSQPISITARIEDMAVLTDREITGQLSLSQAVTHDYPVAGTLVANAAIYGDLFARTSIPFDQQTWTNVWSDTLIGSEVVAQYNHINFPIQVTNASTLTERWAMIFTSATAFNIVGENVGIIGTGNITTDTTPINLNTTDPYFTIPLGGWGTGWSAGNVLRFNTFGAGMPIWMIQAVSQGVETDSDYTTCIEVRGSKDTP